MFPSGQQRPNRSEITRSPGEPITRYFEFSLYLLVVTGFLTLASTGGLDFAALFLVGFALVFRGYLLLRRRSVQFSERWASYFTVGYVAFYLCDLFLLSSNFVRATVHLVLFVMVVKIFSVQRERDHVYLAMISFLSVLAAAIVTVDAVFFASFCLFLVFAASTFISMEMRRSAQRARAASRISCGSRPTATALSRTAVGLALGIAVGASLIFFIMPRLSTGYLSAYAPRNALVTGFSDEVRLGDIGQIQQTDTVVMHVQVEGDTAGVNDLKWRGVALRTFDGSRWLNPLQPITALNNPEGDFDLSTTRASAVLAVPQRLVRYRVLMEPMGINLFFLASHPLSLSGNYRSITVDDGGAVYDADRYRPIASYRAVSNLTQPSRDELRHSSVEVPAKISNLYLELPALDPRLPQLARQITASASTAYDKSVAVERYLQGNYRYTLQLSSTNQRDPLASFLFERRAGHCEYFASSMAVMLRILGIPARVVNGFRGGEFNSVTGSYIVRARHAHSWVEAYFAPYGWVTFDPTPRSTVGAGNLWNRTALYIDALRLFWREWVVNYDASHQMSVAANVTNSSRHSVNRLRAWASSWYDGLLEHARAFQSAFTKSPTRFAMAIIAIILCMLVLLNFARLRRIWRVRKLLRKPAQAPEAAATIFYSRMLRRVGRRGWRKLPQNTPREFIETITDRTCRERVASFTAHYERARFGNSAADAEALPGIYEEIKKS